MKFSIGDKVKLTEGVRSIRGSAYRALSGKVGVITDLIPYRDDGFYSIFFPEVWNNNTASKDSIENLCFHLWENELEAVD